MDIVIESTITLCRGLNRTNRHNTILIKQTNIPCNEQMRVKQRLKQLNRTACATGRESSRTTADSAAALEHTLLRLKRETKRRHMLPLRLPF